MSSILLDLSNSLADAVERAGRNVVSVRQGGSAGVSGTIWCDALIVTAEHTIRGLQELTIDLPSGGSSSATVVGRDPTTDIALMRLKDALPASTEFVDAAQLRIGNFALAVGRRGKEGLAASHGIISALGAAWRTWRGGRIDQWFRLDMLPFTGFSGGPLVDAQGNVIGMNTSGPRRSIVTVPVATVNRVVDQLLSKGRVVRGFLGVALQPVKLPLSSGSASRGLLVVMCEPGGPAESGGVMIGDIILALNDTPLSDRGDLQDILDPEQVGKAIQLRVLRGGQSRDLSLTVAERPEE